MNRIDEPALMESLSFREENAVPDFYPLFPMIRDEWPEKFGKLSEDEVIKFMKDSYRSDDFLRYLVSEDRIIGFYRYIRWPREEAGSDTAHTMDIAVLPEFRKRGLGSILIEDLIQHSRQGGFQQLLSRSLRNNPGSIALHKHRGFSIYKETDDSLVWKLDILSPESR